jgi:hypothetical protein
MAVGAAPPTGSHTPSLDQVKGRLKQQREKLNSLGSLYLETKTTWTSPLKTEQLRKLRGHHCFPGFGLEEVRFSFKGKKLFQRRATSGDYTELPPIWELPPEGTPLQKDHHEGYVNVLKRFSAGKSDPGLSNISVITTSASNAEAVWFRYDFVDRDRRAAGPSSVMIDHAQSLTNRFQPPEYLSQVVLAVTPEDFSSADPRLQDIYRKDMLPDLLDRWNYALSQKTEDVGGAECLVLSGTREDYQQYFEKPERKEEYKADDRLWLDPKLGLALRRRQWRSTLSIAPKGVCRIVNSDFQEIASGLWLPRTSVCEWIAAADDMDCPEPLRGASYLTQRIELVKCLVNEVPDDLFDPLIKPGDKVSDVRHQSPMPRTGKAPAKQ